MRKTTLLFISMLTAIGFDLDAQSQGGVTVQFFTPGSVRILKEAPGHTPIEGDNLSLVITAQPSARLARVRQQGSVTTYTSSELVVTVNEANGQVSFSDRKGNLLLREDDYAFSPISEGSDKGRYHVSQSWALDADEPISTGVLPRPTTSISLPVADIHDWQSLDVMVYPGADTSFTLYEDEGDNYNYEHGAYSTIDFKWNDRSRTLTIGRRNGSFDGMLSTRTFTLKTPQSSKTITYTGKPLSIKL